MTNECIKPVIPNLRKFPEFIWESIVDEGEIPDTADMGAWRQIETTDRPHPSHIRGQLEIRKDMVPARLYGPGEAKRNSLGEVTGVQGQEFDLSQLSVELTVGT